MVQRLLGMLIFALFLASCGTSNSSPGSAPVASEPAPTLPSPTVVEPTSPATAAAEAAPSPAPTAARATAVPQNEGALATSKTAEGYQVLGDPNAPVTLTMYSDFL
jgi:protein-disulfide isomerase